MRIAYGTILVWAKNVERCLDRIEGNEAFFRDRLRDARSQAIEDAEDFHDLLYTFERLGSVLLGKIKGLDKYADCLCSLAQRSPLADTIPSKNRECHSPARELIETVRIGRNDALHQGAFARNLTATAIQLSIVLEDALMVDCRKVGDLMVGNPVTGFPWQPISFIRQQMLAHSFSYVPVRFPDPRGWQLVSDLAVARYLRSEPNGRQERLAKSLQDALSEGLTLNDAKQYHADSSIGEVLSTIDNLPILVCARDNGKDLVGILTAFDLL